MDWEYRIHAKIIDIREDQPLPTDRIFVDTNVWIWLAYSRATMGDRRPKWYQAKEYPRYVNLAVQQQAKLFCSPMTFLELTQQIERAEHRIFTRQGTEVGLKEFRHARPKARQGVMEEIHSAWGIIQHIAECLPMISKANDVVDALRDMHQRPLGASDLFILNSMHTAHITSILTDDGDFATMSGLTMYTSNLSVIELAKNQGKYYRRTPHLLTESCST